MNRLLFFMIMKLAQAILQSLNRMLRDSMTGPDKVIEDLISDNKIILNEADSLEGRLRTNWMNIPKQVVRRFQLVSITNNWAEYPKSIEDTLEYPELTRRLDEDEDEIQLVVDLVTREAYPAMDFFRMEPGMNYKYFYVEDV